MILIDTSAWIEFFRRRGDPTVKKRVAACVEFDNAAYTCPVYFELLAGARDSEKRIIKQTLELCERIEFAPKYWEAAAELEQHLRGYGVTVSRDDIFVTVVARAAKIPILCKDAHFDLIRSKGNVQIKVEQFAG